MTFAIILRQIIVAALAATVFIHAMGFPTDWRGSRDELINRPASPFACGPGQPFCEQL